jgi:hypothetical protein
MGNENCGSGGKNASVVQIEKIKAGLELYTI